MLRTIIIDDESSGINALTFLVARYTPQLQIISTTTKPEEGVRLVNELRPDVVFLDVSMPGLDGFEMLDKLLYRDFKLVFTTAHREFAFKAIKSRATDYLLKPVDIDELKECVKNLLAEKNESPNAKPARSSFVELSVRDGIVFIKSQEIVRLEASGSYTTFFLDGGVKHVASKNLKECESMLDPQQFFRCHASHVVNLRKVEKMISSDGLFVRMSDGSTPEISRRNKEIFLERLKAL